MSLPSGTINWEYRQDTAIIRTRLQWVLFILLLLFAASIPMFAGAEMVRILISWFLIVISVLGLSIPVGYANQVSLGQRGLEAVGAYTTAIVVTSVGLPFGLSLLAAVIVSMLVGLIFGLPAVKIKGIYLAIATIALHYIVIWFILSPGAPITKSDIGIILDRPHFLGIDFKSDNSFYYLAFSLLVLSTFLIKNISRTKAGRAFMAIRDNELAAEMMGVNLFWYKGLAFSISALFAGLAGAMQAYFIGVVNPSIYGLMDSIWMMAMILVGGSGTIMGVFFGTIFIFALDQIVVYIAPLLAGILPRSIMMGSVPIGVGLGPGLAVIVKAAALILFLVFEPKGINHRWEIMKRNYSLHPFNY